MRIFFWNSFLLTSKMNRLRGNCAASTYKENTWEEQTDEYQISYSWLSDEKLILQCQSIFKAKRILNRYSLDVGYIPNLVTFMRYAKCSPIGQFLDWHFPKDKSPMYIFPTDTHISQNGHFPEGHCPIGRTFPWPYVLVRCFS